MEVVQQSRRISLTTIYCSVAAARVLIGRGRRFAIVIAVVGNAMSTACRRRWLMIVCSIQLELCVFLKSLSYNIRYLIRFKQNLYNNLSYIYPDSNIWVIGHSLGGSLASLLGATFGVPVVAFETPGEKMAAGRLHLPSPVSFVPYLRISASS